MVVESIIRPYLDRRLANNSEVEALMRTILEFDAREAGRNGVHVTNVHSLWQLEAL